MYGRQTRNAIAIVSRLAETFGADGSLSADDIARSRCVAKPTVSKILSVLSSAGIVDSRSGRGGGFRLARPPTEITLFDVFDLFERNDERMRYCPFGDGICGGTGDPCPLHDRLTEVTEAMDQLLHSTTFGVFFEGEDVRS